MKYFIYFIALIIFVTLIYLLYKYLFKNLIFNGNTIKYNINVELFENTLPDNFTQNVYSIKDINEITIDNNSVNTDNTDIYNKFIDIQFDNIFTLVQTQSLGSKKQLINIINIDESLNKYKIIFNNSNNKSFSLNHENINDVLIYDKYINNNNNSWIIEVKKYNGTFDSNNFIGHQIVIYSYLDINKCITLQEDGSFKLETYTQNNNKQLFIYNNNYLQCVFNNSYVEYNDNSNHISYNINKFYNDIIVKENVSNELYRIFIDEDNTIYKQKFSNYKVFKISKYNMGLLINVTKEDIEDLPEKNILGFKDIINYYFDIHNIKDGSIIKKKGTYNYFLLENEKNSKNMENNFKKICFQECKDTLSINNNDRVIDIYVRNINNKNISVFVLDENIINAIEYSHQEIINYENVITVELNKYMDLYKIDKFLFNDTLLILRKEGMLYKKTIPNTEVLNLFKLLYKENTDYMKLLFNYPISEVNKAIPTYVINTNPLILNNSTNIVTESNNIKNKNVNDNKNNINNNNNTSNSKNNSSIYNEYIDKTPGILTAKYMFYDHGLLGLISQNKYNYMIIKSDNGNIYFISANVNNENDSSENNKGIYKKYKFYDNQQVQLAFYSKILDKNNILQKNGEYYILSEKIINSIAEPGVPEYYSYKNLLVSLWELNDNLHFNRRDKLFETDKYVDTYSKVVDIDKSNKHYFMKILTYDMYQTMKLSNKKIDYRDTLANTNLTNNAFIQESVIGINRDYYTIPEFLFNIMLVQQGDIISNKDKTKFYKVDLINDINIKVVPTNIKDNIKVVANEALFNIIKQNI
jgi:hypothetical protein